MQELAISLSQILLGWLAVQVFLMFVFLFSLNSTSKNLPSDNQLPKAAVILCLRGADPFLSNCLRSLLNQNYPSYEVKLIVDSQQDPAWQIATEIISEQAATNIQINPLRIASTHCSLKCSSLVQAVSELDDSYKVVALVDADAVVHPNWLRELVSPLAHPKVGATTGNRWYLPTGQYWGSLVRYLWNISAVVQMVLYRIPWGGTLAIKTEVIHQTGLLQKWGRAYAEDTMIRSVLAKHGMRVEFVPSLLILNREECDLPRLFGWLKRQLLASRLYHPWWPAVVIDAILTVLLPNSVLLLSLVALGAGQWNVAVLSLSCFVSYLLALLLLVLTAEKAAQRALIEQGQPLPAISMTTLLKMLIALPLTQWVYSWAMISSLGMRIVNWRGIPYHIRGPWNVHLLEYRPYQDLDAPENNQVSI